tara:strand:+ start:529 stop:1173 length:645 start_codon:yes stop_codon:yes gene_type:complete
MRVVIIHALPESIDPTKLAFNEIYPEAELITLFDEALFKDFSGELTPALNARMVELIRYAENSGADAIGLACSVFAPVVDYAKKIVGVPLTSSYEPVLNAILENSNNIGVISGVEKTLLDTQFYLNKQAQIEGKDITSHPILATTLMEAMKNPDRTKYNEILDVALRELPENVNDVLLSQFSMASSLHHLKNTTNRNYYSPPHCTANWFKQTLT